MCTQLHESSGVAQRKGDVIPICCGRDTVVCLLKPAAFRRATGSMQSRWWCSVCVYEICGQLALSEGAIYFSFWFADRHRYLGLVAITCVRVSFCRGHN